MEKIDIQRSVITITEYYYINVITYILTLEIPKII
jgi:hypothetical protein